MIVSRGAEGLVLVRQVDHQDQCGLMADAWGNADFSRPEPYGPLGLAARIHDDGWREWEAMPGVGEDGAPINFADIDRPTHVELYRRGIDAAAARDPAAGLLVSLHGQGLYEGRRGLDPGRVTPRADREPEVRAFLDRQDDVQAGLRARLGDGPALDDWASSAYRLLQTWDVLSLFLTWRTLAARGVHTLPRVPRRARDRGVDLRLSASDAGTIACAPWPFAADLVDLPVAARTVPDRPYSSAGELAEALTQAEWTTLERRLRPG